MSRFARLPRLLLALLVMTALVAACGTAEDGPPPGADLPKDFPVAQVPLVDGTVLSADGNRTDGWSVTVQGARDIGNVLDAAVKTLTDDGYTESQRTGDGGQQVVILSATKGGTAYWVQVGTTAGAAGGGASVFYQISV